MDSELYKKAEQFIIDSFTKIGEIGQIKHFLRTAYWMKELEPSADDALLIAAVSHDIERANRQKDAFKKIHQLGYTNPDFLRLH